MKREDLELTDREKREFMEVCNMTLEEVDKLFDISDISDELLAEVMWAEKYALDHEPKEPIEEVDYSDAQITFKPLKTFDPDAPYDFEMYDEEE